MPKLPISPRGQFPFEKELRRSSVPDTFIESRLAKYPMGHGQRIFLRENLEGTLRQSPGLIPLWERLSERDGVAAVLPVVEDDAKELLAHGVFASGSDVKMVSGRVGQCHSNAAALYVARPECTRLVTGYALSDDGIWRQHSWAERHGRILETTLERTCYFGVVLEGDRLDDFVDANR